MGERFDMRYFRKGLIVVLESANVEVAKVGSEYVLLSSDLHARFIMKKNREPADYRPDILHQCLMTLLDSPLNKAGLLKIFVHTKANVVIDVSPKLRIPRTFARFSGLMVQLMHKLSIKAQGAREPVLRLVKGPVSQYFPNARKVVSTSFKAPKLVDIMDYVPAIFGKGKVKYLSVQGVGGYKEEERGGEPEIDAVKHEAAAEHHEEDEEEPETKGKKRKAAAPPAKAAAKAGAASAKKAKKDEPAIKVEDDEDDDEKPAEKDEDFYSDDEVKKEEPQQEDDEEEYAVVNHEHDKSTYDVVTFVIGAMAHGKIDDTYADEDISFSQYPLSGSVACGKVCAAFERFFGVV